MKTFWVFIRKEFWHVLRDPKTLFILFGLPITQILIFGFALTNEVRNSRLLIVDQANDAYSKALIARLDASAYFDVSGQTHRIADVERAFRRDEARAAVVFPAGFAHDIQHRHQAHLQYLLDGSDPNTASIVQQYLSSIVQDEQKKWSEEVKLPYTIDTRVRMLYNPQMKGAPNFVPGVMAMIMMLVCVMMTAVSIVREKETGTMEVLLVSPVSPARVVIGKSIPYLVLSLLNILVILLLSYFLLDLPIKGSPGLLLAESVLFIITCLALGTVISVRTDSQQVAMLISFMGMLLPTLLFSGFMFPIENMPLPLQMISRLIPARWFYTIVKAVMIKGLGFQAVWKETLILLGMTLALLAISIRNFKVRLA